MNKTSKIFLPTATDLVLPPAEGETCTHGVTFDSVEANRLLREAPARGGDPALAFVLGSTATAEIQRRWPRGRFTAEKPCPFGCGFVGIAYASYEHYLCGDW